MFSGKYMQQVKNTNHIFPDMRSNSVLLTGSPAVYRAAKNRLVPQGSTCYVTKLWLSPVQLGYVSKHSQVKRNLTRALPWFSTQMLLNVMFCYFVQVLYV